MERDKEEDGFLSLGLKVAKGRRTLSVARELMRSRGRARFTERLFFICDLRVSTLWKEQLFITQADGVLLDHAR